MSNFIYGCIVGGLIVHFWYLIKPFLIKQYEEFKKKRGKKK